MSTYKEYRSKVRITARVVERDIKVAVLDGDTPTVRNVAAGDYEVLATDGTVSYQDKATFEAANEPVRKERTAKTKTPKKKAQTTTAS